MTAGRSLTGPLRGVPALLAQAVLALLGSLLVLAHAPALVGWASATVVSGSMSPRIQAGDVLVVSPVRPQQLAVGQVLLVDDPVRPHALLSHRLVRIAGDGSLVLRGDANAHDDSTPVPLSAVHGVGRLRVPVVGLPVAWLSQGRYASALAAGVLVLLALALVMGERAPVRRRGHVARHRRTA